MRAARHTSWSLLVLLAVLLAFPASALAGSATQFLVFAPLFSSVAPGVPFQTNVLPADATGNGASFSGTLGFTSSDPHATLPSPTTIGLNEIAMVSVTMTTVGVQTITVTQTDGSLTGTGTVTVFPPELARLTAGFPTLATSAVPVTLAVTGRDKDGDPLPSYDGVVHFTSSDPAATLPPDTRLTNGTGTFTATLRTAGAQTISATDVVFPARFKAIAGITVERPATHLQLAGPLTTLPGFPALVGVRALDATGAVAGTYAGTVHFSSSDANAQVPADVKLVNGQASASVTFQTPGLQTISATDTKVSSIAGTSPQLLVGVTQISAPPPGGGTASLPPASVPVVRGLAVRPLCVRRARLLSVPTGGRGALGVSFALSAGAQVSVAVVRLVHAKALVRCTKRVGSTAGAVKTVKTYGGSVPSGRSEVAIAAGAGRRVIALAGTAAAAKALVPGAYLVRVRATDAAGHRSALASAKFFVLR